MDDAKLFSKHNILKFAFESALVVGSIIFALFLDEYGDSWSRTDFGIERWRL